MNRIAKNAEGFTLLEVIASVAILSIVSIPLMSAFMTSLKINTYSVATVKAKSSAESLMELLLATPYSQFDTVLGVSGVDTDEGVLYILDDDVMHTTVNVSEMEYEWNVDPASMVFEESENYDFIVNLNEDTSSPVAEGFGSKLTIKQDGGKIKLEGTPNPVDAIEISETGDNNSIVVRVVYSNNENSVVTVNNMLFGRTVRVVLANYSWNDDGVLEINSNAKPPRIEVEQGWVHVSDYSIGEYTIDDLDAARNSGLATLAYKILIQTQTGKGHMVLEGIKVTE